MPTNSNAKSTFKTILLKAGKTATGIKIPPEIIEKLDAGKKPPIKVTINGFTYRSTVAVMGGAFMVGVNAENRVGAGTEGGDEIEVTVELDTQPRELDVPASFEKLLNKNSEAKRKFELLSFSRKKALIVPIANAKTDETRNRNIEKALNNLLT